MIVNYVNKQNIININKINQKLGNKVETYNYKKNQIFKSETYKIHIKREYQKL